LAKKSLKKALNGGKRERWSSKIGIILAVSGSAVGLGNFLKFPGVAAANGGGSFLIPYFVALICLGIPLMWIEWTLGRLGGAMGHGTAPGIFQALWRKNRWIKYIGLIGLFGPLVIFIYYTYIESWLLGYAWFALTGKFANAAATGEMGSFQSAYLGLTQNQYFSSIKFFVITFILNFYVVYRGVNKGIEFLSKIAMPILTILAILIALRVATLGNLGTPFSISDGFGFMWNPDFSLLLDAKVWLAAAGQIFFTLSIGIGVILTYASYLNRRDDVALSGLTSVSTNQFLEVVLAGSIVVPATFAFLGPVGTKAVVEGSIFNIGFITMPQIFAQMPLGAIVGILWFSLLFLAGITSSISLAQPFVAFLEDEFKIKREQAVLSLGALVFVLCQPAIFWLGRGVVDELDFWGGTIALVLFGTVEVIMFTWVFGIDKAWKELHVGADIKIPIIFRWMMRYVTPLFLLVILGSWLYQAGFDVIFMTNVPEENKPYILFTRLLLVIVAIMLGIMIKIASKKWRNCPTPKIYFIHFTRSTLCRFSGRRIQN